MSNPFPGMDPYLEGPLWSVVHHNLIEEFARQLTPKLRPKYRARTEERIVVAAPDPIEVGWLRRRSPDVSVVTTEPQPSGESIATLVAPLTQEFLPHESLTETFLEIRTATDGQLVTAIELLSPTNKRGEGAAEYHRKRREILASESHLLEVDLLRIGECFPVTGPLPSVSYSVFLSRANRRPKVEIWPLLLEAPLPIVPVPLLDGDQDVELDVALAFRTIYDLFEYDRDLDYSGPPTIRLSPEQSVWADGCLRAAGKRFDVPR